MAQLIASWRASLKAMEETWNLMSSQNHLRISTLTCSLVPKLKKAMSYLSLHGLKRMHQCPPLLPVTRLPIEFQCQAWPKSNFTRKNREAHRRNCRCIAYMIPALNGRIPEITSAR
uniref:Uncharacterized protein n=1 Tax=Salix viminalis TaxID=40686 RepID=A0A6N2L2R4_SALVM